MRTKATVVALDGNIAIAECDRTSACDGCHKLEKDGECSVCSLMGAGRTLQTRARNDANAKVGDIVMLESATGRVLWYAVLVFLVPIAAVIAGYCLSGIWIQTPAWRYLCAFGAFILTFLSIRLYSERGRKHCTDVRVTEILSSTQVSNNANEND